MNRIRLIRVVAFVCVLVALTLIIRTVQSRRAEKKAETAAQVERLTAETNATVTARIKVEEKQTNALRAAADAHARFLTKYVNTNITKRAGSQMVAVAVLSEASSMNHAIGTALVNHFKTGQVQLSDSFFKPELAADGLFERAFNGDTALFNQLELTKSLDALVLARQEVQYETNADLNNVVTAAMQVEIVALPVAGQSESHSWTFTANGVGIRRTDARSQAEERIIKQIASDKKMLLNIPNP